MFEQVLDLVGRVPTAASTDLPAAELLERIGAVERAIAALQAQQVRDLAAFADARVADDEEQGVPLHLTGRTVGTEVGDAVGVSAQSGAGRASRAWVAVAHHPRVLGLLGTGPRPCAGSRPCCGRPRRCPRSIEASSTRWWPTMPSATG